MFGEYGPVIMFVVGQIVVAAAVWGGIKADIAAIHRELSLRHEQYTHRLTLLEAAQLHGTQFGRNKSDNDFPKL